MAYCRWSEDGGGCDIYAFQDVRGVWRTRAAAWRLVRLCRAPQRSLAGGGVRAVLIGGQFDGQTFNDLTLEAFRDRLLTLRDAGYRLPADVLTKIDAEIAERDRALATTP